MWRFILVIQVGAQVLPGAALPEDCADSRSLEYWLFNVQRSTCCGASSQAGAASGGNAPPSSSVPYASRHDAKASIHWHFHNMTRRYVVSLSFHALAETPRSYCMAHWQGNTKRGPRTSTRHTPTQRPTGPRLKRSPQLNRTMVVPYCCPLACGASGILASTLECQILSNDDPNIAGLDGMEICSRYLGTY